ncbi:MAG: tRNA (guanosine(46)-N7)-methyltransferase TrmB [Alphaproteobacteria bacterium]|nr:tRNA (guanosine(46)-N7)-methyltransferase TrmB [Alphaproteobacteria bacterium]
MTTPHAPKVYGRRKSRPLKQHTQHLYETLLPKLIFDVQSVDIRELPKCCLEIGFGGGEHLAYQALKNPEVFYIGAEPFINGVASLLKLIDQHNIQNIRIWPNDIHLLFQSLPDQALFDNVYLLFADPWPKKRHHHRRFVQDQTIERIHRYLKADGKWFVATDHAPYREWIIEHFERHENLFTQIRGDVYARPSPEDWPITRYEEKGTQEGRQSAYFIYQKI